jgi:hypothetical protein
VIDADNDGEEQDDEPPVMPENMTLGYMEVVDGELLIATTDRTELDEFIEDLEREVAASQDDIEPALDGMDLD